LLHYHPGTFGGGLTLVRTAGFAAETSEAPAAGWDTLARGPVVIVDADGDHTSMLRAPHVIGLAARLGELLDAADTP
jgi:thioesterase domain-containing protein